MCIQIDGDHIRVMWIDHLYDSKRTVFMGNLPFDVKVSTSSNLRTLFFNREYSQFFCVCFSLMQDEEVYQLFTAYEASNLVLKKGYLKLRDRELNCELCLLLIEHMLDWLVSGTALVRASKSGDDKKKTCQKSPAQTKMRPEKETKVALNANKKAELLKASQEEEPKRF
ncbi:unnamed protein product [Brassica rapa subsp. trilocularis]